MPATLARFVVCVLCLGLAVAARAGENPPGRDSAPRIAPASPSLSSSLRVAMVKDHAPFSYLENGRPAGIYVRLLEEIAENLGVKIEFVSGSLPNLLPGVYDGTYDLLAGAAVSRDGGGNLDFAHPLGGDPYRFFGLEVASLAELTAPDTAVAVLDGDDAIGNFLQAAGLAGKIVRYPNYTECLLALRHGDCRFALVPYAAGREICEKEGLGGIRDSGRTAYGAQPALATRKGNLALIAKIKAATSELERSGRLRGILRQDLRYRLHDAFGEDIVWIPVGGGILLAGLAVFGCLYFVRRQQETRRQKEQSAEHRQSADNELMQALERLGHRVAHIDLVAGTIRFSEEFARSCGYASATVPFPDAVLENLRRETDSEGLQRAGEAFRSLLAGQEVANFELSIRRQGCPACWERLEFQIASEFGRPVRAVAFIEDVTEQHAQIVAYKQFTESRREKADNGEMSLVVYDISDDRILSFVGFRGWHDEQVLTFTLARYHEYVNGGQYISEDNQLFPQLFSRENLAAMHAAGTSAASGEFRALSPTLSPQWFRASVRLLEDPFNHHVVCYLECEDVSEEKENDRRLREKAERDGQTGLYNRTKFKEMVQEKLAAPGQQGTLLVFDIDNLRGINDAYGRSEGDYAISLFVDLLKMAFAGDSVISRLGGDSFSAFICREQTRAELHGRLERLLSELAGYKVGGTYGFTLNCHIGGAILRDDNRDFNVMNRQADYALFQIKNSEKRHYAFYSDEIAAPELAPYAPQGISPNRGGLPDGIDYPGIYNYLQQHCTLEYPEIVALKNPGDMLLITAPDTYEISLALSLSGEHPEKIPDWEGKKCYEALRGRKTPCPFCKIGQCTSDGYFIWNSFVDRFQRECILKDRLLRRDGQTSHLQLIKDISSQELMLEELHNGVESRNLISRCTCSDIDPLEKPREYMEYVLKTLCEYFNCDSGFIFTTTAQFGTVRWNLPEDAYLPQRHNLTEEFLDSRLAALGRDSLVYLADIETLREAFPQAAAYLGELGTHSLVGAHIADNQHNYGFITLCNMKRQTHELTALNTVCVNLLAIIRRAQMVEDNYRATYFDRLTGFLNYEGYKQEVAKLLKINSRKDVLNRRHYAVCDCDIRNFKLINDVFGRGAGDHLLRHLASIIAESLRDGETFCRMNSDHFSILQYYGDVAELTRKFQTLAGMLAAFFDSFYGTPHETEAVCGFFLLEDGDQELTLDDMLSRAGMARNKVKNLPGSNCNIYDEAIRKQGLREHQLGGEMENAMKNGELCIYLQPQVFIGKNGDGKFHAEALSRWMRDGKFYASPGEFIPLFERTGAIQEFDTYVFGLVCRTIKEFKETHHIPVCVAVNISRISLLQPDFVQNYNQIRLANGVECDEVMLEFTESIAVTDLTALQRVLDELKKLGYRCSMDDFGSFNSSLNVLHGLRLDELKLDQKFFRDESGPLAGGDSARRTAVVNNVLRLAGDLSMHTVAEGIESMELVEQLRAAGCSYIQGYVFSKPLSPEDFRLWALSQPHP